MDKDADDKMVSNLIAHRQKSLNVVRDCFGLDPSFAQAVSQAFEVFINKRENKPAEMMGNLNLYVLHIVIQLICSFYS